MKILSYNVNGIRSASNKGLWDWIESVDPDIVCFQEIKADVKDLSNEIVSRKGYFPYFFSAQKKGYSGVAVYTKNKPIDIQLGLNIPDFDSEGRNIILNYQNFILVNSYFPSGTTGEDRQRVKDQYLDTFTRFCVENEFHSKKVVLCGDFNICREPIDIHNPVSNKNSSGFLPHERKWFSEFLNLGFVDAFREFNKEPGNYTWWSYRAGARIKNLGWRIDYHLVSLPMMAYVRNVNIFPHAFHSDHCPVLLEIDQQLA